MSLYKKPNLRIAGSDEKPTYIKAEVETVDLISLNKFQQINVSTNNQNKPGGLEMLESRMTNMNTVKNNASSILESVAVILLIMTFAFVATGCSPWGDRGFSGTDGVSGQSIVGPQGTAGADGSSCSTLPADDGTGALIMCTNGSSAFIKNGERGLQGNVGETGSVGASGTNATSVTMVKLCPNIVGSYNNFPEFAFQIDGKLYATMSTAGVAFTTQLYPGNYTTTTNAGNCAFVVNSNNQLTL